MKNRKVKRRQPCKTWLTTKTALKAYIFEREEKSKLHSSDLKNFIRVSIHPSALRRELNAMGLKGCVAVRKLLLRKENRNKKNLQII